MLTKHSDPVKRQRVVTLIVGLTLLVLSGGILASQLGRREEYNSWTGTYVGGTQWGIVIFCSLAMLFGLVLVVLALLSPRFGRDSRQQSDDGR